MTIQLYSKKIVQAVTALSLVMLFGCIDKSNNNDNQVSERFEILEHLVNFDSKALPDSLEADGATVKRVSTPGTDKGGALEIRFSPDVYWSIVRFRPKQPWNWSSISDFHIAIDAKNIGSESVQVYLVLTDANNVSVYRGVNLASGESGTYFAVLDGPSFELDSGLRESPPPWDTSDEMFVYRFGEKNINLGKITELALKVRGTLYEKNIVVDNIRLRRNAEYTTAFLENFVDEFGQNAKQDYPIKIHSLEELKKASEAELASLAKSGPMPDRSRFGGWKNGPRFKGTGYFRTKKVNGKWWMVDPDGYLFFSHGIANVRIANLTTLTGADFRDSSVRYVDPNEVTPEDSIGIVKVSDEVLKTRYISSPMRRNMFTWLPDYNDDLADHFSYRRSVRKGPMKSGETFSFYRANLERRYGQTSPESYLRKWEEVTLARMLDWGFTSMGNWVDPAFYPNKQVPYFANGWIIGNFKTLSSIVDVWAPMPDPFDPEFVRRAEITINVVADEIKASPWCVGVFIDNEKSWGYREGTVEQRYGLILDALSHTADESPAKSAFTKHLRDKYGDIKALNEKWNTKLASWDEFSASLKLTKFTPDAVADLSALLELLSEEYFKVVHNTLEKALPNHLYMGARMANWGMPDETIKASLKYSDVLSFNIYEEGMQPHAWAFLNEIDLPTIIGEFHVGATQETGLFHAGLVQADGQADRAKMYKAYMESVAAHDNMVGAHWFQYVDSPITGRAFDGEPYNVGFVTVTDIPYPEMVAAAKEFNSSLYPKRYGTKQ